jgi:glc operon protein GlcG
LGMGMSTRQIRDRLAERPSFQAALAAASGGRFIPTPGGVLIVNDQRQAIGAVGISGDASDKDEFCAIEAIRAAGLTPEPLAPAANWQGAGL